MIKLYVYLFCQSVNNKQKHLFTMLAINHTYSLEAMQAIDKAYCKAGTSPEAVKAFLMSLPIEVLKQYEMYLSSLLN